MGYCSQPNFFAIYHLAPEPNGESTCNSTIATTPKKLMNIALECLREFLGAPKYRACCCRYKQAVHRKGRALVHDQHKMVMKCRIISPLRHGVKSTAQENK